MTRRSPSSRRPVGRDGGRRRRGRRVRPPTERRAPADEPGARRAARRDRGTGRPEEQGGEPRRAAVRGHRDRRGRRRADRPAVVRRGGPAVHRAAAGRRARSRLSTGTPVGEALATIPPTLPSWSPLLTTPEAPRAPGRRRPPHGGAAGAPGAGRRRDHPRGAVAHRRLRRPRWSADAGRSGLAGGVAAAAAADAALAAGGAPLQGGLISLDPARGVERSGVAAVVAGLGGWCRRRSVRRRRRRSRRPGWCRRRVRRRRRACLRCWRPTSCRGRVRCRRARCSCC